MKNEADEPLAVIEIPDEFFQELLPNVSDLGELKVILHLYHIAAHKGTPGVSLEDVLAPDVVHSVATAASPIPSTERVRGYLERAIANGSVLRLTIRGDEGARILLLPSTAGNRVLVAQLGDDPQFADALRMSAEQELSLYRPNVFSLFERHIGPLTPIVAEQLLDAERSYPRAWIEAAILEAELYNKRNWRYIEAILTQWEERGAPENVDSRPH